MTRNELRELISRGSNDDIRTLIELGESEDTTAEFLTLLAKCDEPRFLYVRLAVAKNCNTSAKTLTELAMDDAVVVVREVARNPNTPANVLDTLLEWSVYESIVARNPNTSVSILKKLAKSGNWELRREVAGNKKAPKDILAELAKDEVWMVRKEVAGNPSTPIDVLRDLSGDEIANVREAVPQKAFSIKEQELEIKSIEVSRQKSTSPEALRLLAEESKYWKARFGVVENPNTPDDVIVLLTKDKNKLVCRRAKEVLVKRNCYNQDAPKPYSDYTKFTGLSSAFEVTDENLNPVCLFKLRMDLVSEYPKREKRKFTITCIVGKKTEVHEVEDYRYAELLHEYMYSEEYVVVQTYPKEEKCQCCDCARYPMSDKNEAARKYLAELNHFNNIRAYLYEKRVRFEREVIH